MEDDQVLEWLKGDREEIRGKALHSIYLDREYRKKAQVAFSAFQTKLKPIYDWEDIFTQAITRLVSSVLLGKYDSNKASLTDYFSGICWNLCRELVKARDKMNPVQPDDKTMNAILADTENECFDEEILKKLKAVLSRLSEKCQKIIELRFWQEKSGKEIAGELFYSGSDVVKVTFERCKNKLKTLIEEDKELVELLKKCL